MSKEPVRILLMEDDAGQARLFRKRMERAGYAVDHAPDGEQGLAMYDPTVYDLVATDHAMPVYDGLEVIRRLAERGPLPPIIMVTGTGNEQVAVEAMKLGARDYIVKDVDGGYLDLLPSVIDRTLHQHHLEEQMRLSEEALAQGEKRFRDVTENAQEWVWEVDAEGKYTFASPIVEKLLGYKPEEMLDKHFYDLFLPEEREELKKIVFAAFTATQPIREFITRNVHKNGGMVWLLISGVPILGKTGNLLGYRGANNDITERRKAQEDLENANIQLQALVQEAEERNRAMALLNAMSEMLQACQTSEEAFSVINHFVPKFFPNDTGALYLLRDSKNLLSSVTTWGDAPPSEELFHLDDCWAIRSGRLKWVENPAPALLCKHITGGNPRVMGYLCVPLMAQGVSLGILHIRSLSWATGEKKAADSAAKQRLAVAIAENLALALANLKLRETLRSQAIRDSLTGLFNRRYLEETLERELSRSKRADSPLGVIMMDLDHFKEYNDTYGHNAGDELLSALGHTIQEQMRREDIACRYGGEEFLLIMPGAPLEVAVERAQIINESVRRLYTQDRALKPITISAGVAIFPAHGATGKDVIKAADAAMYKAKEEGRDGVVVAGCDNALQVQ